MTFFSIKYSLLAASSTATISAFTMFRCLCLEWILMLLFEGFLAPGAHTPVRGTVGQNITLPCHYSTDRHGITTTCWGRGACPTSKCVKAIVWTDGRQVTFRQSSMYQLMGNIDQGDVALTIVNVTESATGTYCCHVEIRGWNNDQKTHVEVVIEKGNSDPASDGVPAATRFIELFIPSEPTWTTSTESPPDNISMYFTTLLKEQRKLEKPSGLYTGIGIAAVLLFIIPCVILLLLKWYLPKNQKKITLTRPSESSVTGGIQYILESGICVQENIYELN